MLTISTMIIYFKNYFDQMENLTNSREMQNSLKTVIENLDNPDITYNNVGMFFPMSFDSVKETIDTQKMLKYNKEYNKYNEYNEYKSPRSSLEDIIGEVAYIYVTPLLEHFKVAYIVDINRIQYNDHTPPSSVEKIKEVLGCNVMFRSKKRSVKRTVKSSVKRSVKRSKTLRKRSVKRSKTLRKRSVARK